MKPNGGVPQKQNATATETERVRAEQTVGHAAGSEWEQSVALRVEHRTTGTLWPWPSSWCMTHETPALYTPATPAATDTEYTVLGIVAASRSKYLKRTHRCRVFQKPGWGAGGSQRPSARRRAAGDGWVRAAASASVTEGDHHLPRTPHYGQQDSEARQGKGEGGIARQGKEQRLQEQFFCVLGFWGTGGRKEER